MNLAPLPIQKFFDNDGNPLVGGLLFTYVSGTTTKIATYTDSSGGASNTNPIVLDFRGECRLWIDPTKAYTFVLAPRTDTDPPTNPFWTVNDITAAPFAFDNSAVDTGSVNNIALAIPQITSPVAFTRIVFKAANTNTAAVTISINGGTAKALTWQSAVALFPGAIVANGIYEAVYDGAQWQLQGPTLDVGNVKLYGALGNGAANDTAAFVAAIATGQTVSVPPGNYLVDGGTLTMSTAGQMMVGSGRGATLIKKRTNGNLLTLSASFVTLYELGIHNDDAATLTGFNVHSDGDFSGIKILNCNMFRSLTNCLRIEGGDGANAGHVTIRGGSYNNAPAGAGTPPIYLGKTTAGIYSMLYGQISDIQAQPSGNPIRFDAVGGVHISDSQISGWDNNVASGLSTVNSVIGCRVTGPVSIEGSGHVFSSNAMGAYGVTFEAGSSGCWYVGNAKDAATTITNSGGISNIILDIDTNGIPAFLENFRVNNNKAIRLYNAAGTNFGQLAMSAADNLSLSNLAGSTQVSASSGQQVQMVVNGVEVGRFDGSAVATQTRFMVYDVDNATLERVTVGAADSGGVGFKVLRIPN